MKKIISAIISGILIIYFLSFMIMAPYFNWIYARENGFMKWILFGEIIATAKSVIWPYYIFFEKPEIKSASAERYMKSKNACDEAIRIIVKKGGASSLNGKKQEVIDLLLLAISESKKVSSDYLEKIHPEFSDKYINIYRKSIDMLSIGLKDDNAAMILGGSYGYNEFADWVEENKSKLDFKH